MGGSLSGFDHCQTLVETLKQSAELRPDKEVFIFYDKTKRNRNPFTAYQIYELGGRFASRLHHHGFQKGDVIANTLPNSPERLITDVGIILAGCTGMNGQILLADGEDFFSSAKTAQCSAVILPHDETAASWRLISPYISDVSSGFTTDVSCDRAPTMKRAILVTRDKKHGLAPLMEDLISSRDAIFTCQGISPEDYAYVHVTSGSTGYSKMVPRSHRQLLDMNKAMYESLHALYPYGEKDVSFNDRSLGWVAGFPYAQYCMGATRVLMDTWNPVDHSSDVEGLWRILRTENCTTLFFMPTLANAMLNNLDCLRGSKVKVLLTGGQPITKDKIDDFLKLTDNVLMVYGSTEIALASVGIYTKSDVDSNKVKDYLSGQVQKYTNMRIVDTNDKEVPVGETGEIQVKGITVFNGYINSPDKSADFTPDGWFRTGDYGFLDDEDNLYVKGRSKELIHHGNLILYPTWLEERISTYPDLQEVCVVPVPHPVLYHAICACVKRKDDCVIKEDDLKAFCESLFLINTGSKLCPMPEYFMILGTDFPLTNTGKIDRQKLKKMAAEKFGTQ